MGGILAVGEMLTPASFFFLPFAVGAIVAGVLASFGLSVNIEWIAFVLVSVGSFAALWPLGRRMERSDAAQEGVGATRWVGQEARVVEAISENGYGTVRLEREVWRAESLTGAAIKRGSTVVITRLAGTRLVVVPVDEPLDDLPNPTSFNPGESNSPSQGAN